MADQGEETQSGSKLIKHYSNNVVSGDGRAHFGDVYHNYKFSKDQEIQDNLRWLGPPDVLSRQEDAQRLRKDDTGSWLMESHEYLLWKANEIPHIWLYGKAGSGKSILCSTVVHDLLNSPGTSDRAAFFYYSFADKTRQSYNSLLRSLVSQLTGTDSGRQQLVTIHREKSNLPTATRSVLEEILVKIFSDLGKTYVCIDALDECPMDAADSRDDLLDRLPVLVNRADGLKLFVTSRRLPEIDRTMSIILARPFAVNESRANADIAKFVKAEMKASNKLRALDKPVQDLILTTFDEKANGMFRWAFCQMQNLKRLRITSASNIRTKLATLPKSLDETYERMLRDICDMTSEEKTVTLTALKWLVAAKDTLFLDQLVEVCKDGIRDPERNDPISPLELIDLLGDLVSVRNVKYPTVVTPGFHTTTGQSMNGFAVNDIRYCAVDFAHLSVQEYLLSGRLAPEVAQIGLTLFEAHTAVAMWLHAYILSFRSHMMDVEIQREHYAQIESLRRFPLLYYCLEYWHKHSTFQRPNDAELVMSILSSSKAREHLFLMSTQFNRAMGLERSENPGLEAYAVRGAGPLHIAARLGLESAARQICERGIETDRGCLANTLMFVCRNGTAEMASLLLSNGADANVQDGSFTALQIACLRGDEKLVQVLLNMNADVNAQYGTYGNALRIACYRNNESMVKLLLDHGANVNAQGALQNAGYRQAEGIVRMLIEHGADMNMQDEFTVGASRLLAMRRLKA